MLSELKDVYDLANKNNVSIYALDPRGLAVFEHDVNEAVRCRWTRPCCRIRGLRSRAGG